MAGNEVAMNENKDLLYFIEQVIQLDEYWKVNYYLRSMKKAPHGGVVHVYYPNIYLKHYSFQPRNIVAHEPERIPHFMRELVDIAVNIMEIIGILVLGCYILSRNV